MKPFVHAAAATAALLTGCSLPLLAHASRVTSAEPGLAIPDEHPAHRALVLSNGSIRGFAYFGMLKVLAKGSAS